MKHDNKQPNDGNKKIFTDIFGFGEVARSFSDSFVKLIEKMPFGKLTANQSMFLVTWIIFDASISILKFSDKINDGTFNFSVAINIFLIWRLYRQSVVKRRYSKSSK